MIQSSKYYLKFEENSELFDRLRTPIFLKTELDVVYDDFVRWENYGLLIESQVEINVQRRYSYVEYTWVKVVEQLRNFGFDYKIIKSFKDYLNIRVDDEFYELAIKEKREELLEYYTEEEINEGFEKGTNTNTSSDDPTFFEGFIINVINYNDIVSLLFFHNTHSFCVPVSAEIFKEMEQRPEGSEYLEYLKASHVSVSINEIIKKFVINDLSENTKSGKFKSILSTEEHNLLKIIRKKYKDLKSIKIRFESNEMKILEVKTTKKATAESRLLEHIKKGEYSTIQIESVDGTIVNFENTQKYKL